MAQRMQARARHPVLDLVTESDLDGTCHGWDGTTVFRLSNGQVWRQSAVRHRRLRLCCPAIRVWRMGERFWLEFEGVPEILPVERVTEAR
jgi:hypothetical protein